MWSYCKCVLKPQLINNFQPQPAKTGTHIPYVKHFYNDKDSALIVDKNRKEVVL